MTVEKTEEQSTKDKEWEVNDCELLLCAFAEQWLFVGGSALTTRHLHLNGKDAHID